MIRKIPVTSSRLVLAAGVAALLGVVFLVVGGKEMGPPATTRVAEPAPAGSAFGASQESIRVAPAGSIELVDSMNTPPALLAALVLTGKSDPAADRVEIDIPVASMEAEVAAAPESRVSEAAPESPIDSVSPPPPVGAIDPGDTPVDSPEPRDRAASSTAKDPAEAGGFDLLLIPPVVLKAAWLEYPREARKRKSEGVVEVRILVDLLGNVSAVEIERGAGDESLNKAAMDAARQMRFRAARQGDRPVAVWFNYQFSFRLPS